MKDPFVLSEGQSSNALCRVPWNDSISSLASAQGPYTWMKDKDIK